MNALSGTTLSGTTLSGTAPSGTTPSGSGEALYRIDQASFAIAGRTLLENVSLVLPKRRVIGLIGHNGSGKSTLLKLLARQLQPSSGSVAFEGCPLPAWEHRAFARRVAYLSQHLPGTDGMTARELVQLGRYPWHGAFGRFSAEDRRRVQEAIELTGISDVRDRPVDSLSGGERQRVWMAMLVAQESACMLLDEPISALDVAHQIEVLGLIRRLSEERGVGVVMVLHDINMAARFCDELIALKGGRLLTYGSCAEIMAEDTLHAIYGVPMGVFSHPVLAHTICFVR